MKKHSIVLNAAKAVPLSLLLTAFIFLVSFVTPVHRGSAVTIHNQTEYGKDRVLKIYPDMFKRVIHVKYKGEDVVDFYVFDDSYKMVFNNKLGTNDHITIENLTAGEYVYEVFKKDKRIEFGKVTVK